MVRTASHGDNNFIFAAANSSSVKRPWAFISTRPRSCVAKLSGATVATATATAVAGGGLEAVAAEAPATAGAELHESSATACDIAQAVRAR